MATSSIKVSFLGLGGMGNAMAKNILNKGFQLVVWNRTSSKATVSQHNIARKRKYKIFLYRIY